MLASAAVMEARSAAKRVTQRKSKRCLRTSGLLDVKISLGFVTCLSNALSGFELFTGCFSSVPGALL